VNKESLIKHMSVSHVLLCHGAQQDQLAQSLIPFNAPSGLIAHKVVGDGNCLYYATSLSA